MDLLTVADGIFLKQLELSDADDIFEAIVRYREYLGVWLPFVEQTRRVSDTLRFIHAILDEPADARNPSFVIHVGGDFAGMVGFKESDYTNRRTEIGYWLCEPFQKKGIMTAAVKLLTTCAFTRLGMNRVQIKCAVGNTASKKIPRRLGFALEGVERDGELLGKNIFTDLEVHSRLAGDVVPEPVRML